MAKILVVEDEAPIRANLKRLLGLEGYQVIAADNGRIGVELAGRELPDLILCDLIMPELDGYGVLSALRADPATAAIPLVIDAYDIDTRHGLEQFRREMSGRPCSPRTIIERSRPGLG